MFRLILAFLLLMTFSAYGAPRDAYAQDKQGGSEDVYSVLKVIYSDSEVTGVSFSPDGRTLASGSGDKTIRLWDVGNGRERARLNGSPAMNIAFNPDGSTLAWGSFDDSKVKHIFGYIWADNTIHLWNLNTGRERAKLEGHSKPIISVAFSPDGRTLASGSTDETIRLWDVATGQERAKLEGDGYVSSVAFSPDGRILASGSVSKIIHLWDVATGRERARLAGHSNSVLSVAFSPDGRTLASGSYDNIRLWDLATGRERARLIGHSSVVLSVAFSPDGRTLASGSGDKTIRLWDPATGQERAKLEGHSSFVFSVAFSPNGRILASSGCKDKTIRLWKISTAGSSPTPISPPPENVPKLQKATPATDNTAIPKQKVQEDPKPARPDPIPPPPAPKNPAILTILEPPQTLKIMDGATTPFSVKVRNDGLDTIDKLQLTYASNKNTPLLLNIKNPQIAQLLPKNTAEFEAEISFTSEHEAPKGGQYDLQLRLSHADGKIDLPAISVTTHTPSLVWIGANWEWGWNTSILKIRLQNTGDQALGETMFNASLNDNAQTLDEIQRKMTAANEEIVLGIALPKTPTSKTLVSLVARTSDGLHEWHFNNQPITQPWPIFTYALVLLIATIMAFAYFRLYRHPLVVSISATPATLLSLPYAELRHARSLLRITGRLAPVLRKVGITRKALNAAINFQYLSVEGRYEWLKAHLLDKSDSSEIEQKAKGIFRLKLGNEFLLNLDHLMLCFPATTEETATLTTRLEQDKTLHQEVVLILHPNEQAQRTLHDLAKDPVNQWVAPSPEGVTELLLDPNPLSVLAKLIAAQISLEHTSPYKPAQGVEKKQMFFGRTNMLAHITGRDLTNYLVVGGRQLGKTSLLKFLKNYYENRSDVECHFIAYCQTNPLPSLASRLKLPKNTGIDELYSHIVEQSDRRCFLFMFDEADKFVMAERDRDYSTLKLFRALSEEGRAHFILAGFWELYMETVHNYQSPLLNFGETLNIAALEPDACKELATRPMKELGINYAYDGALDRLLNACGGRANLINIACNEMLLNLKLASRTLDLAAVNRALDAKTIHDKLECWNSLGDSDEEKQLAKIIVDTTIEENSFTLAEVSEKLKGLNIQASLRAVEQIVERLTLLYVVTRRETRYYYAVPLFREKQMALGLEKRLQEGRDNTHTKSK